MPKADPATTTPSATRRAALPTSPKVRTCEAFDPDLYLPPSTGDFDDDCETGGRLAKQLIAEMRRDQAPYYLGWVITRMITSGRMIKKDGRASGVLIGLCGAFGDQAIKARCVGED